MLFFQARKGTDACCYFQGLNFFSSKLTFGNRPSLIYNSSEMLTCQSPLRVLSSLSFYIYALFRKFLTHYHLRPLCPTKNSNYPDLRYKQAIEVVPVPMARRLLVHVLLRPLEWRTQLTSPTADVEMGGDGADYVAQRRPQPTQHRPRSRRRHCTTWSVTRMAVAQRAETHVLWGGLLLFTCLKIYSLNSE